ncbi:MAG: VWA domain-containing protein [Rhodothermales bacterium]
MSFINSIFLFAMGAAVLPVLFHFVRKMRAKKVPFGSLMFLKATPRELIKKRRLKDLLLMALRAAIFGLLALVFARPFIPEEHLPFISQREDQSVVMLIDNSYSMQVGDLFERARQEALDRLDDAGRDDEFSIIAFADEAQQLTPLSRDLALHRNVVTGTLAVSNRPTDFYDPLRLAADVLQDARHDDRTIVLISDFQRNGWTGSLENWTLAENIRFVPVKVTAGGVSNAYVEAFNLGTKRTGNDVAIRYDARIKAQGRSTSQPTVARLDIDGQEVEQKTLPALPTTQVSFQRIAPREGFYQGTLALGTDDLPVDNRYYFTYPVAGRPSILVVDEGERGSLRDAFFLQNAFALGETALYEFTTGNRQRLSRSELRNHEVVFLANVASLTGVQLGTLRAYVENGGSAVISFGEDVNLPMFSNHLRALGVGRADRTMTTTAEQGTEAIIGQVDLRHPVFELFAASGMGAILRPRFRRYARVVPDSGAAVIGTYDTDDPFLIERRLGRGKVLVYTSTFSTSWTDFPINELYVPFVYQLVKYAISRSDDRHQYTVGEVVAIQGRPGEEWDVQAPGNRLYKVPIDASGTGFFRETEAPGQYVAARGRAVFPFSVNIDAHESVLASRDEEEAYVAVVGTSENVATTPEAAAELVVEDEEKKQKLWRYVLLLVVGLFALETVLAHRRVTSVRKRKP